MSAAGAGRPAKRARLGADKRRDALAEVEDKYADIDFTRFQKVVDIDTDAVIVALSNIEGVIDLHHVHFWQMGEHDASLEAHVIIEESAWDQLENIKYRIKQALAQEFNIRHSTLEFELPDHFHKNGQVYGHG